MKLIAGIRYRENNLVNGVIRNIVKASFLFFSRRDLIGRFRLLGVTLNLFSNKCDFLANVRNKVISKLTPAGIRYIRSLHRELTKLKGSRRDLFNPLRVSLNQGIHGRTVNISYVAGERAYRIFLEEYCNN